MTAILSANARWRSLVHGIGACHTAACAAHPDGPLTAYSLNRVIPLRPARESMLAAVRRSAFAWTLADLDALGRPEIILSAVNADCTSRKGQ